LIAPSAAFREILRFMAEGDQRTGDDLEALSIIDVLAGIPDAWRQAQESIEQAGRRETVPLSEL
jgi:hypothetical protein